MQSEPQKEHQWLQKLVGEWVFEGECIMGPDQPPMKQSGSETVRSLGGLWTVGEGRGDTPDGEPMTSIMTLGYDPTNQRFIGSFIASVMTHFWPYEGTLDAAQRVLTLDSEGPGFSGGAGMVKFKDAIEFVDDDHRILTSSFQGPDGKFTQFMTAQYRRRK